MTGYRASCVANAIVVRDVIMRYTYNGDRTVKYISDLTCINFFAIFFYALSVVENCSRLTKLICTLFSKNLTVCNCSQFNFNSIYNETGATA